MSKNKREGKDYPPTPTTPHNPPIQAHASPESASKGAGTKRKIIAHKLKRFLSVRPSQEELYERKILGSPYQSLPLRLSIWQKLVDAFEAVDGSNVEGIFRISGNAETIRLIWNNLRVDAPVNSTSPHDIAGAMKLYLRELPQPIIPSDQFSTFVDTQRIEDSPSAVQKLKQKIKELPDENYQILDSLFKLLSSVTEKSVTNKMNAHNIGVCFGPNLLRAPPGMGGGADMLSEIQLQCNVVSCILNHKDYIFGYSDTIEQSSKLVTPQKASPPNTPSVQNLPKSPVPRKANQSPATPKFDRNNNFSHNSPFSHAHLPPPPPPLIEDYMLSVPPPIFASSAPSFSPHLSENSHQNYEELLNSLIDDLSQEEKSTLIKRLTQYFLSENEQFKVFLKEMVGIDGVIALLEVVLC
eukprot:TRINITY_DN860_c0_g1_i1.p1 TRINITY_DN860_c0_g1~~TRINITY_DN860_c0_g1_i1.p1  ORF type:complete len:411 (+),score=102.45 TRINITY_DN860_c0_g1_i1:1044-2276(+)